MKNWPVILLLSASTLYATELNDAEREQLLERLRQLHAQSPSFQAEFREERASKLLQRPIINEGEIALKAPAKFRREIKGPNRSLTISNGRVMWIYYPNFSQAERYELGQGDYVDQSISALTAGLNFQRVDEIYDVKAYRDGGLFRLELTPKRSNLRRIIEKLNIWLDDGLRVRRSEAQLRKGERMTTDYKNPRRVPLADSAFEFAPPPGTDVSEPLRRPR